MLLLLAVNIHSVYKCVYVCVHVHTCTHIYTYIFGNIKNIKAYVDELEEKQKRKYTLAKK